MWDSHEISILLEYAKNFELIAEKTGRTIKACENRYYRISKTLGMNNNGKKMDKTGRKDTCRDS